jgi:hypothetical protein
VEGPADTAQLSGERDKKNLYLLLEEFKVDQANQVLCKDSEIHPALLMLLRHISVLTEEMLQ